MARGRKTGGRKKSTPNRRTIAQQEVVASGMSPLEFLCAVFRDPKQSMTRGIEAARCVLPCAHARLMATEFLPPPLLDDDNEIRIVFIDPQGKRVPFEPPPELAAAATGANTLQQLDVDRSQEDRQLLTR